MKMITAIMAMALALTVNASDYMYFKVNSFWMNGEHQDYQLFGETEAIKMDLQIGTEVIQIDASEDDPFKANVVYHDKKIKFYKDYLSFSTPFEDLEGIDKFNLLDAEVELSKDQILMEGQQLDFVTKNLLISVQDTTIVCDPEGTFSTEIDKVCLNKAKITAREETDKEFATVNIKDLTPEKKAELLLKVSDMQILPKEISANAASIRGTFEDGLYTFNGIKVSCDKLPELRDLDPLKIIRGCYQRSDFEANHFSMKRNGTDANVLGGVFKITEDSFNLVADGGYFISDKDRTDISKISISCKKLNIFEQNLDIEKYQILRGCLEEGNVDIDRILMGDDKDLMLDEKISLNDIKDVKVRADNHDITVTAKVKKFLRWSLNVSARSEVLEEQGLIKLHVIKARVAGFDATKAFMKILKKFVSSEDMQIEGNTVILRL